MTEDSIIIAFIKEAPTDEPQCLVGIDLNEKSAALPDGTMHDLSEVARLHTEYGVRRSDFYEKNSRDSRLVRKFAGNHREKERVGQFLHKIAKEIVKSAKSKGQAIVLERLKGIRYKHKRGNWEAKTTRRRIAQWPFRVLQAFIV